MKHVIAVVITMLSFSVLAEPKKDKPFDPMKAADCAEGAESLGADLRRYCFSQFDPDTAPDKLQRCLKRAEKQEEDRLSECMLEEEED